MFLRISEIVTYQKRIVYSNPIREIAAKQIIKRYGVFISADTNGYNPKENRNNPNIHAFLEIIRFE